MESIWVAIISGLMVAVVTQGGSYLRERKTHKENQSDKLTAWEKSIQAAVVAVLHDALYDKCSEALSDGSIDVDALENIETIYTAYHDLGGNGTGTSLYKRVSALKIKE